MGRTISVSLAGLAVAYVLLVPGVYVLLERGVCVLLAPGVCPLPVPAEAWSPAGAAAPLPPSGEAAQIWRELLRYGGVERPLPKIRVYAERLAFQRAAAGYVPAGAVGVVGFYLDGRVHLVKQADPEAERRVLRHELVHALLDGGGRVPRWFNEGVATYLEEAPPAAPVPPAVLARRFRRLCRSLEGGRSEPGRRQPPPVNGWLEPGRRQPPLETGWSDPRRLRLLYAAARTAVQYLAATRGEEALRVLVGRLARGEDFDAAFPAVYGASWATVAAELSP